MPSPGVPLTQRPLRMIKGVGENRAKLFERLGLFTVGDLLQYYPRDYEDRSVFKPLDQLTDGESVSVRVKFVSELTQTRPRRNLSLMRGLVSDGTGVMTVVWFNQPFVKDSIQLSMEYNLFGQVKVTGTKLEMHNPVVESTESEKKGIGHILPVYPLTRGITQNQLRVIMSHAVKAFNGSMEDILPISIRNAYKLSEAYFSIEQIHFPQNHANIEMARKRLVFEELLLMQLSLLAIKGTSRNEQGMAFDRVEMEPFLDKLCFKLTRAQMRVWQETEHDMEQSVQMNRLIQGDVGSGKTVIAMLALYKAVKSGYQGAFMVPTEILAEQHYRTLQPFFEQFGIQVGLLTGSIKKKEKEFVKNSVFQGMIDILIGTHAVLEEDVEFNNLGLVITDEQHRFGVRQRARLSIKGVSPDLLVMTATPIPRTLTLALYGDLDVSVIDELPPDRKPIKTYSVDDSKRERVYAFIRKNVAEGRQAYIVCPLVEDSEEIDAESATGLLEKIQEHELKGLRTGLIHGKMKANDKEEVMRLFVKGELDVLVSTTVIEVGVNVPNASIMVIENAERFGLSQLHQLRGRVGRGQWQSFCILFNQGRSKIAKQRMEIMAQSNDGFVIADKDLELRGPGDIFGIRQHGLPEFKITNLYQDMAVLKSVQVCVEDIIGNNLLDRDPAYQGLKAKLNSVLSAKLKEITMN